MTTDMIRCSYCGSIDPSLYSNRKHCCELVVKPLYQKQTIQLILWNTKKGFGLDQ